MKIKSTSKSHLYKVSYDFKEMGLWRHATKNIVANGSVESALRKAKTALKKLEPDAKSLIVTSIERICQIDAL